MPSRRPRHVVCGGLRRQGKSARAGLRKQQRGGGMWQVAAMQGS